MCVVMTANEIHWSFPEDNLRFSGQHNFRPFPALAVNRIPFHYSYLKTSIISFSVFHVLAKSTTARRTVFGIPGNACRPQNVRRDPRRGGEKTTDSHREGPETKTDTRTAKGTDVDADSDRDSREGFAKSTSDSKRRYVRQVHCIFLQSCGCKTC